MLTANHACTNSVATASTGQAFHGIRRTARDNRLGVVRADHTEPPYKSRVRAIPPSTEIVSPVTNRAASEARNTMTSAMSSGVAHLRSGVWFSIVPTTPAMTLLLAHSAVSTTPGATALTLI